MTFALVLQMKSLPHVTANGLLNANSERRSGWYMVIVMVMMGGSLLMVRFCRRNRMCMHVMSEKQ